MSGKKWGLKVLEKMEAPMQNHRGFVTQRTLRTAKGAKKNMVYPANSWAILPQRSLSIIFSATTIMFLKALAVLIP